MQLLAILTFLYLVIHSIAEDVENGVSFEYTASNFDVELPLKHHFVMFYAPWCWHCKNFAPTWEQLAEILNEDDSRIRIAKVDCTSNAKLCGDQDITGYPTLKFYKVGDSDGVKFSGTRDLPTLTNFINERLKQDTGRAEFETEFSLKELTDDNFESVVNSEKAFIKFYAPWCGHCQRLAPTWLALANAMEFNEKIIIAKIDCTAYRDICTNYDVKGYPTMLWFENGVKIDKYTGERSLEELKNYVNKMAGRKVQVVKTEVPAQPLKEGESVVDLSAHNFIEGIKAGVTFVDFYSPSCGHCKRLAPTWEQLGKKLQNASGVKIAKVDCTTSDNRDFCNQQEIIGFPSLFLYKDGEKISQYEGNRELDDLYEFVNTHLVHDEL